MFENLVGIPDTSTSIRQGDIFKDILFTAVGENLLAILVTPECDIFQGKAPYLHFCALISFHAILGSLNKISNKDFLELNVQDNKGKTKDLKNNTISGLLNNKFPQYQWLGKFEGRDEYWVVDFTLMECIKNDEALLKDRRLYRIKSPLNEAVFVRNGAFMSRVGLPENPNRTSYIDEVFLDTQEILAS